MSAGKVSNRNQPSPAPFGAGVFIWAQPGASQMAGNTESSADYQGTSGQTAPRWSPPLNPAVCLLGAAQATRDTQETLRLLICVCSAWFCPSFSPSEQSGGWTERRISLDFPAVQAALSQQMSKGRLGAGCPWAAGQGNRWLHRATKDSESTPGVQGTSQIRTFKGLPSLQWAIGFKGEDTHHLAVILGIESFLLVWFYEAAPGKISKG